MALADDIQAVRAAGPATFDKWLEIADDEDRAIVLAAVQDPLVLVDPLVNALRKNGVPITRDTIVKRRESR